MNHQTTMGPLARDDLYESLEKQLLELPSSFKVIFKRDEMKKPFFPITVIEGSDEIYDQELFGPIYQIFKA
jgi:acyl-CoA reductase-like NAD-dependent aldehyde dehydrogenase